MADFDPVSYMMGQKAGPSGGSSTLSGLTDVDISNPTDGQTLVYNAESGKWENGASAGGIYMLDTGNLDTITIEGQSYEYFEYDDSSYRFKLVDPSVISDFNLVVIKTVRDGSPFVTPAQVYVDRISAQDPASTAGTNICNTVDITAILVDGHSIYLLPSNGSYAPGTRK